MVKLVVLIMYAKQQHQHARTQSAQQMAEHADHSPTQVAQDQYPAEHALPVKPAPTEIAYRHPATERAPVLLKPATPQVTAAPAALDTPLSIMSALPNPMLVQPGLMISLFFLVLAVPLSLVMLFLLLELALLLLLFVSLVPLLLLILIGPRLPLRSLKLLVPLVLVSELEIKMATQTTESTYSRPT